MAQKSGARPDLLVETLIVLNGITKLGNTVGVSENQRTSEYRGMKTLTMQQNFTLQEKTKMWQKEKPRQVLIFKTGRRDSVVITVCLIMGWQSWFV